eukprot:903103-Pyramimonas_sp.AAC.1
MAPEWDPSRDGPTSNNIHLQMETPLTNSFSQTDPPLIQSHSGWIHHYWNQVRDGSTLHGILLGMDAPLMETASGWTHV